MSSEAKRKSKRRRKTKSSGTFSSSSLSSTSSTTRSGAKRKSKRKTSQKRAPKLSKQDFQTLYNSFQKLVVYESKLDDTELKEGNVVNRTVVKVLNGVYESTRINELCASKRRKPTTEFDHCQVCFIDYDDDVTPINMENCRHQMCCTECFKNYIRVKVADKEIMPWLICPDEKCKVPISTSNLLEYISPQDLVDFSHAYLQKTMVRAGNWVECKKDKCDFGFLAQTVSSKRKKSCRACGTKQIVSLKTSTEKLDDGFQKMVKEGLVRLCPTCKHPAMKDYGMCNIMECGKCGVWWNWRNYETGKSYSALKQRSRNHGTLWEPGELQYQLNLERSDPKAFKNLLESNGMKYDPNFVRGQS